MRRFLIFTGSSVALAIAALALVSWSFAADAHLRFPVKWDEPRIAATIKSGETQQIDVKLTASYDLPKMSVFVGPRIRPYVTASTSIVGPLKKGQSAIVSLALAAPITATPTTTEGLIFLFATSTTPAFKLPLPKPLPVKVAVVWPTLTTPSGITVSYPATLKSNTRITDLGGPPILTNFSGAYLHGGVIPSGGMEVAVADFPKLTGGLSDLVQRELSGTEIEATEAVLVAGENATQVSYSATFTPTFTMKFVTVYVPLSTTLYKFSLSYNAGDAGEPEFLNTFQRVLDSTKLPK